MERRYHPGITVEKREDGGHRIVGYAAVFYREDNDGTQFRMYDDLIERISPGAFDRAIKEGQDVRALFNHDPAYVLGRSKSGTMRLSVDATGLKYDVDMPDTVVARDLVTSIQRGDITGSSFGFVAKKVEWQRDDKLRADVRTLKDVDLLDVSPVAYPAYEATSADVRSGDATKDRDAWRKSREAVEVRLRVLRLE